MKKIGFLLLLACPLYTAAQKNHADSLRFEMIRQVVNFLATDPKVSKNPRFTVACTGPNYNCLEVSADKAGIPKLINLVRSWDAKKHGNTAADLQSLRQKMLDDISAPPKKSYRTKLHNYGALTQKLQQLVAAGQKASAGQATAPQAEVAADDDADSATAGDTPQTATEHRAPITEPVAKKTTPDTQTSSNKPMDNTTLTIVALAASIVAIIISFMALPAKKNAKSQAQQKLPEVSAREVAELRTKINDLESRFTDMIRQNKEAADKGMQRLENRITDIANSNAVTTEIDLGPIRNKITSPHPDDLPLQAAAPPVVPTASIRYAKFSDMHSGGFSPSIITEKQNGEQTYEIWINGQDTAEYAVATDGKAQRYALQNYEYLNGASDIQGSPQPGSQINTLSKGTLTRAADGSWMIDKRAVIEFN